MSSQNRTPGKLVGDAGEHYALSQLSFAGKYAAKMPDNWEAYDLVVEAGTGPPLKVSVKTRTQSDGWTSSKWFNFDDRKECDWIVLIFKPNEGVVRSWVIPFAVARENASVSGPNRQDPWSRDVSWKKLTTGRLAGFENNWSLNANPNAPPAPQVSDRADP